MLATLLVGASCGGGTGRGTVEPIDGRRVESARSGRADGLAAALALVADLTVDHPATPRPAVPLDRELAQSARDRAADHLWTTALGADDGVGTAGSARIRRLAQSPGAPSDTGDDGSNLDDTLARELGDLARLAGRDGAASGFAATMVPRRGAAADLRGAAPRDRTDLAALRTARHDGREVDAEQIGAALLLRARLGMALARARRGGAVGANPDDGWLGLVALQGALALDETLLTQLTFDGAALGAFPEPARYDPAVAPRWIPARVAFTPVAGMPNSPAAWQVVDRASSLRGLAAVLRGAAELGWVAAADNPLPELRALFVGTPLEPPSGGVMPPDVATWVDDVRPIVHGAAGCLGCHGGATPQAGFSLATYEDLLRGGRSGPAVVAGDHASSPLWLVLEGPWLPPGRTNPVPRMPLGRPQLPAAQRDTIRRFLDDGAQRESPPIPPRARVGLDLARAMLANARALHEVQDGPGRGLLESRAGTARSGLVDAAATGLALRAAAALAAVDPSDPAAAVALEVWALAAHDVLTRADGTVHAEWDLRRGAPADRQAGLHARASLAAGLLAAGRVRGRPDLAARGARIATAAIEAARGAEDGWLATPRAAGPRRLGAPAAAATLDMLRELQLAADPQAAALGPFVAAVARAFAFSEFAGEVLGDGIPDTDGDGVVEPAASGRVPMLADAVLDGAGTFVDPGLPITWSEHVLPLFRARCAGCHVDGSDRGRYRVDTPELAARPGESGIAAMLVAGDPEGSFVFRKLADRAPSVGAQMPLQRPPLAPHELELVRRWILDGARDR